MAAANQKKQDEVDRLARKTAESDAEFNQERLKTVEYNERLYSEKLVEERHQISVNSARAFVARAKHELKIAQEQLA